MRALTPIAVVLLVGCIDLEAPTACPDGLCSATDSSSVEDTTTNETATVDSAFDSTSDPDTGLPDGDLPDTDLPDTGTPDSGTPDMGCGEGTHRCTAGGELQKCTAGMHSTVVACPSAATCNATLGRCTVCTPSTYACSGTARQQCDSFGAKLTTVATCATPELCLVSSGVTCTAATCGAGEKRCMSGAAERCNAGRTAWESDPSCPIGCSGTTCLKVLDIVGGPANHVCALLSDGTVRCWGSGHSWEAGGSTVGEKWRPTVVSGVTGAVQVGVGNGYSAARMSDGTLMWWGRILTTDPPVPVKTPSTISGLSGVVTFSAGEAHLCARVTGGGVKCIGFAYGNQLGSASGTHAFPPSTATVPGISDGTVVSVGATLSFAETASGWKAWGAEATRLGITSLAPGSGVPNPTATYPNATQISAERWFSCARISDGTVKCSGKNDRGQLGDGTKTDSTTPVTVMGITTATMVAAGDSHACALLADKTVKCWGANGGYQLSDTTLFDSATPVAIPSLTGVTKLVSIYSTLCALLSDEVTVKCWGDNGNGQVGADKIGTFRIATPTPVAW